MGDCAFGGAFCTLSRVPLKGSRHYTVAGLVRQAKASRNLAETDPNALPHAKASARKASLE